MNNLINNDLFTAIENMNLPPTLYSLMNSIANYGKDESEIVNTYNLSKVARTNLFDFEYDLTEHLSKEEFECMILDHFIMRRIGFETPTMFKIQLKNKIKTIMPLYNKLFDALDGWNLFSDGELISESGTNNNTSTSNNSTTMNNENNNSFSDTPQNHIENVTNSSYVTDYTHSTSNGTSTQTGGSTSNDTSSKTIQRTIADKMALYKEFITYKQNIFDLIFKDLECLFYGLY